MTLALTLWLIGCLFTYGLQEDGSLPCEFFKLFVLLLLWPVYLGEFVRDLFVVEEAEKENPPHD